MQIFEKKIIRKIDIKKIDFMVQNLLKINDHMTLTAS